MSDQARLAEIEEMSQYGDSPQYSRAELTAGLRDLMAALREAERRAEEAESKLATAADTIRSLQAVVDADRRALRELRDAVEGARWQIEEYLGAPMAEGPLGCFRNLDAAVKSAALASEREAT